MKRSLVRLFVAVVGLLASVVELAVKLVQLAITLVERAARRVEGEKRRVVIEAPAADSVQVPVDATDKLVGALTGLGFRAGPVRAFAATVRSRIGREPIDGLVKEGIVHLYGAEKAS
jgi:hypothetical protein